MIAKIEGANTLMNAHHEWANRKPDERFSSIASMHAKAVEFRRDARVAEIKAEALRVAALANGELGLVDQASGNTAKLTNWSFGQMCRRAQAPAAYLAGLPTPLAADCLNEGLSRNQDTSDDDRKNPRALMQVGDEGITCRAITSHAYSRIWNSDITSRLVELERQGTWKPAPAAFDGSRGLYLSDRDMFAFMVDNERRIFETLPGGGLSRGFFVGNSEVGARRFYIMSFLYEYVCGNHRVWGAQQIGEVSVVHIGKDQSNKAFDLMQVELKKYAESSARDDEAMIENARKFVIGATKDDVLNAVFGLRHGMLTRSRIGEAYDVAEKQVDWYGAPNTVWGLAGGLTQIARDMPHAGERTALDQAATKVMEMAF
jgi:hypothetical protein